MQIFTIIYTVLGGLGIFFLGMKFMSDALQAAAGDVMKNIINSLTTNRILAVLVGCGVTCIVQSSSITTVMVVGMVNAGLMSLTQAIGVIFGANIGTTITGWIISIKIGKYGLVFVGLGFIPMLFAAKDKIKHVGRVVVGFGLVFIGLELMSDAFKPLRDMPEFLNSISYFSGQHYGAYLASILVGCVLTMIVQSSSAMLGITIALATTGVISFHTAAALVLGENIGTTITAILASIGANANAKRAARAHSLFNCFGVLIMFCIFPFYVEFIDWLIPNDPNLFNDAGERPNIAVHIATAHSMFNVLATLFFLPFLNVLAAVVTKITPDKKTKEQHHLVVLGSPAGMMPAAALILASKENKKLMEIVLRMFKLTKEYVYQGGKDPKVLAKIKDYEKITDNIQKEITVFAVALMEHELTHHQSAQAMAEVRVADELESVADYLDRLASSYTKFTETSELKGQAKEDFDTFMKEVYEFVTEMDPYLDDPELVDIQYIERKSETLRATAESIRVNHLQRVSSGEYSPLSALTYSDMVVALRKIRSHTLNIAEALDKIKAHHHP
jgi:phosphate:Na+ symporter